jgi:alkyldihydroxyacetonephosphate synthase
VLVLAFESADHPVDAWIGRALEIVRDHGGRPLAGRDGDPAGTWRERFLRMPYLRDVLVRHGLVVETFETACTWDRYAEADDAIRSAAEDALRRVCGSGAVTCRFTHVYPDGVAPYYTVYAPGRWGSLVAQWDEVKAAVSEAIVASGATITHHHAVGRDHRPWYEAQRPDVVAAAFVAARRTLDPAGIMNPGVLFADGVPSG